MRFTEIRAKTACFDPGPTNRRCLLNLLLRFEENTKIQMCLDLPPELSVGSSHGLLVSQQAFIDRCGLGEKGKGQQQRGGVRKVRFRRQSLIFGADIRKYNAT